MITAILPSLATVQSTNRGWNDADANYLYNIFNARTIQAINPQVGTAYRVPIGVLGGRLLKFEVQVAM